MTTRYIFHTFSLVSDALNWIKKKVFALNSPVIAVMSATTKFIQCACPIFASFFNKFSLKLVMSWWKFESFNWIDGRSTSICILYKTTLHPPFFLFALLQFFTFFRAKSRKHSGWIHRDIVICPGDWLLAFSVHQLDWRVSPWRIGPQGALIRQFELSQLPVNPSPLCIRSVKKLLFLPK